jgi:hypothetical protein
MHTGKEGFSVAEKTKNRFVLLYGLKARIVKKATQDTFLGLGWIFTLPLNITLKIDLRNVYKNYAFKINSLRATICLFNVKLQKSAFPTINPIFWVTSKMTLFCPCF